jgi:hypothetical protein
LRCPGRMASMKARLICLIRQHQWHRNDYEYPTVWIANAAERSKSIRETPAARVRDRTFARGSAAKALD